MRLSHAMPDGITLERLARDVHRDTQRFKTRRLHLQTLLAVRVNGIAWRFMQDASRRHFYAKTLSGVGRRDDAQRQRAVGNA